MLALLFLIIFVGGSLFYFHIFDDLKKDTHLTVPYAEASISTFVNQHRGALRFILANPTYPTHMNATFEEWASLLNNRTNIFRVRPGENNLYIGVISLSNIKNFLPGYPVLNDPNSLNTPLTPALNQKEDPSNPKGAVSALTCLTSDEQEISPLCDDTTHNYLITYAYQQPWWSSDIKEKQLWKQAFKSFKEPCGYLSCTGTINNCRLILNDTKKVIPLPLLSTVLVKHALINTGASVRLDGLLFCITELTN